MLASLPASLEILNLDMMSPVEVLDS